MGLASIHESPFGTDLLFEYSFLLFIAFYFILLYDLHGSSRSSLSVDLILRLELCSGMNQRRTGDAIACWNYTLVFV